ncbi:hypothetical protein JIG36_29990 [Actinoplanes sp. LDG1-06]|uniref:Uncharacterized protein n=1 Tax=Paractinoplanes ovalisporus TaxID=2810368 RepID=A0ABS2AK48_9ACTN|nr:hypothetical protein [Actinoplanes ovalisporus]MBM2619748.1 hypothetical protein [Actinoplanes ovalisporus]
MTYNPETNKGFVGSSDLIKAFGWTDATLKTKAAGLVFNHDFWTDDTYSVTCAARTFPVAHHREFGRYELFDAALNDKERGGKAYAGKLVGFWLTGPRFGISGTSVGPTVGQPCPDGTKTTVMKAKLVSTTVGWGLSVSSGDLSRVLTSSKTAKTG